MLRLALVGAAMLAMVVGSPVVGLDRSLDEHWNLFKTTHAKSYESEEVETYRRAVWESNVDYISQHNREADLGIHTFTVGLNEYADMTNEEFVSIMNGYIMREGPSTATNVFMSPSNVGDIPDTVDWRTKGYVTEVKNQGQCGSCWAFSTTGSLEGQTFKKTGKLTSLSEQNLVDCSRPEGNKGCQGGLMDNAFTYIKKNDGIDTEASYKYKAKNGKCKFSQSSVGAEDTGYTDIPHGDEDALKNASAAIGPISVAIDASKTSFQLYKRGVYNERRCSSKKLDHGVLVVGYGTEGSTDYWLVKNSWGPSWGLKGYVMMSRNKKNQCGIATQASYPLV